MIRIILIESSRFEKAFKITKIINLTWIPSLSHVPYCHIHVFLKYFQRWVLHVSFPRQPVPILNYPLCAEILPNIHRKYLLMLPDTNAPHFIICPLRKEAILFCPQTQKEYIFFLAIYSYNLYIWIHMLYLCKKPYYKKYALPR